MFTNTIIKLFTVITFTILWYSTNNHQRRNSSIYPPKIHALPILEAFHNYLFMPKSSLFLPAPNIIRFGSFGFYHFIVLNVLPYALLVLALGILRVWWMCYIQYHINTWCIISTFPPPSFDMERRPLARKEATGRWCQEKQTFMTRLLLPPTPSRTMNSRQHRHKHERRNHHRYHRDEKRWTAAACGGGFEASTVVTGVIYHTCNHSQ